MPGFTRPPGEAITTCTVGAALADFRQTLELHVKGPLSAMTKRDVVRLVLAGKRPPYVPWSMGFTQEAKEKLQRHYGCDDVDVPLENHLLKLGSDIGFFTPLGNDRVQDVFGVAWDRSIDRDIGNVAGQVLARPSLAGYAFPNPLDPASSPTYPGGSPAFPTASACSRSAFRCTSGPGRCGAWKP